MAPPRDDGRMAAPVDSDEHRKRLQHVLARLASAEELHNQLVPEWVDNYRSFRARPTTAGRIDKEDWQSDVRSPYVAEQMLTMLPRLVEGRPDVDVQKLDPSIPSAVPRAQGRWLKHQLYLDQFPMKAARLSMNTLLFGVGFTSQSWLHQCRVRQILNRETGEVESKKLTIANRPTMRVPHPIDAMWDPSAEVFETARFVILRTMSTVGQVHAQARRKVRAADGTERWVGRYSNTEDVKSWGRDRDQQFPNMVPSVPGYMDSRLKNGRVEVLELLDKELDRVIVVANRAIVMRDTIMPWWHGEIPVACAVTTPDVGVMHGIAEAEWIRGLQDMLHLLENQRLDNTRLQMDMVLLVRDSLMDLGDYQLSPGAKWPVTNMDDIQPLQYAQPQLASVGDVESIRGRMQAIIGSAFMTGGDASSMGVNQETASGLMSIIEEGNRRVDFRMNMMLLAYDRALSQMLSDGGQFLDETQFMPGVERGSDPIPVSPEDLAAKAWVRVKLGSETGLKSMRQQTAQTLAMAAQAFMGTPIPTPEGMRQFNMMPVLEEMAVAFGKEPEEFLFDAQAMLEQQQQMDPAAAVAGAQQAAAATSVQMPGGPPGAPPAGAAPAGTIVAG